MIEYVCEPKVLFLAWQAPDHFKERYRWAVAEIAVGGDEWTLRYFKGDEFRRINHGRSIEDATALGYQGFPAFNPRRPIHGDGVLEALMRRLPPINRPDFDQYKQQFRLPATADVSSRALLATTEAKLPSDGFSVVDPLDPELRCCDLMLEVAGFRYYAANLKRNILGEPVDIVPEPTNDYDEDAVMLSVEGDCIGYVNRLQAKTFGRWCKTRRLTACVERLNGSLAKPRAFVFVRVRERSARIAA